MHYPKCIITIIFITIIFLLYKQRQLEVNGQREAEEEVVHGKWQLSNNNQVLSYTRFLPWMPSSIYSVEFLKGTTSLSLYL